MKIESISTEGLKASDRTYALEGTNVLFGANGAGKSTLLVAIRLLALGAGAFGPDDARKIPATNDGVMRLARGNTIKVSARIRLDNGKIASVTRQWTRGGKGEVKESYPEWAGLPSTDSTTTTKGRSLFLHGMLAPYVEAWNPQEILGLSPDKMRARLLALIPAHELRLEDWVPKSCPDWGSPSSTDHPVLEWVQTSIHRGEGLVSKKQSERREAEAHCEDLDDGWKGEQSIETLQAELGDLREKLLVAERTTHKRSAHAEIARKLEQKRDQVIVSDPITTTLFAELVLGAVATCRSESGPLDHQIANLEVAAKTTAYDGELIEIDRQLRQFSQPPAAPVAVNIARLRSELEVHRAAAIGPEKTLKTLEGNSIATADDLLKAETEVGHAKAQLELHRDLRLKTDAEIAIFVGTNNPLPNCPHCGVVLDDAWMDAHKAGLKRLEVYQTNEAQARADLQHWTSKAEWARAGIRKAEAREAALYASTKIKETAEAITQASFAAAAEHAGLVRTQEERVASLRARRLEVVSAIESLKALNRGQVDELRQQLTRLPPMTDQAYAAGVAVRAIDALKAQAQLKEQIAELEMDAEIAAAEADESPSVDIDLVHAEIRRVEEAIEERGRANERAHLLAEAKSRLARIDLELSDLGDWVKRFKKVQSDLLDRTKAWLEIRFSRALGAQVRVELLDPRGNPTCRISAEEKDVSVISGGEYATFVPAILLALAESKKGEVGWRPLFVDGLEAVSKDRRMNFIRAIATCQADGIVDQAFLAGCPDQPEAPEGVNLIVL